MLPHKLHLQTILHVRVLLQQARGLLQDLVAALHARDIRTQCPNALAINRLLRVHQAVVRALRPLAGHFVDPHHPLLCLAQPFAQRRVHPCLLQEVHSVRDPKRLAPDQLLARAWLEELGRQRRQHVAPAGQVSASDCENIIQ